MDFPISRWLLPTAATLVMAVATSAVAPREAGASVSIPVSWDGLLQASTEAVVATPADARSDWENGRIYTYSRVHVDRAIAGALAAGADAWVRTMGGIVGDTGQRVEGEAQLVPGQPSLLFLQPGPSGSFHVTARAQGQFPVIAASEQTPAYVVRSGAIGALVPRHVQPPSVPALLASEALHGRTVDDAVRQVLSAWNRTHPR
jgi:hypothetical protein